MSIAARLGMQAALAVFVLDIAAFGDVISSRQALNLLLGPAATTEDFEHLTVDANDQYDPDNEITLDSTTVATLIGIPVGGPGLVQPGIQFVSSQQLAWNGDGYYGLATNTLFSNSSDSTITVLFTEPVDAFGLDLLAFQGYGDIANVEILGPDQTTVIFNSSDLVLSSLAAPAFFGFEDAGGIGGAVITEQIDPWSPVLDNVTFGEADLTSTPEPAALALIVIGLFCVLPIRAVVNRERAGTRIANGC